MVFASRAGEAGDAELDTTSTVVLAAADLRSRMTKSPEP